jgi:predicted HAD superfamily hydrolase
MKQTGSLFKYVLQQENIRPEELVHRGDNPVADLEKPRSLGILTDFYDRSVPSHWD